MENKNDSKFMKSIKKQLKNADHPIILLEKNYKRYNNEELQQLLKESFDKSVDTSDNSS